MAVFFLFILAIVIYRRPDQFFHPYIWSEDGAIILPDYIASGWKSIFYPINGYLVLPSRLISILAFKLSFRYYPEIAVALHFFVLALTVISVWISPTLLAHKFLCALAILLIPTNSENFGVPLYTFWWTSLLLFLVLLWQKDDRSWKKWIFLLVGGFSSTVIIPVSGLLILRATFEKSYQAWKTATSL